MLRNLRTCSLILALVLATVPPAFAANGSLKVTSFPSGAEVWVAGTFSGKLTPMSISLPEGDHTVRVQIPNSGWNPDQRIVTIVRDTMESFAGDSLGAFPPFPLNP